MEVLQITGSPTFDTSIIRKEFRSYSPYVESFNNSDQIRIAVQSQDLLLLLNESYLCCTLSYTAKKDDAEVPAKLQNNFMAFLFDEISLEICGVEVDRTRNLGITTALKNYMSMTRNESLMLAYSGWLYNNDTNHPTTAGNFEVCLPLKKLLGICEDYIKVLVNIKLEIVLTRARSDNNCVILGTGSTFNLKLHKLQWKIPVIQVDDMRKLSLMKLIEKGQFLSIPFRCWDLYEFPNLPTSNKHVWNVKTSTNLEKPRYIIFGLQTNRKNQIDKDSSEFDPENLGSVRIYLNSTPYPSEEVRFNLNTCFSQIYEAYTNFRKVYYNDITSYPMLTMSELKKQGLIFIDCSHQEESLKGGVVDLAIHIETADGESFKNGTTAYCLVINDKVVQYDPLNNIVRKLS